MRVASDGITFTAARTVTVRDDYLIQTIGSGIPREAFVAFVELAQRWADPPVTIERTWETPAHEISATLTRLYEAINESRRVTSMLVDAIPPQPAEEVAPS